MSEEKRYRFGSQFRDIVAESKQQRSWYSRIDVRGMLTIRTAYMATSVTSFIFFALYGVMVTPQTECLIQAATGRCCSCVSLSAEKLAGQTIPTETVYNDMMYGAVVVTNSVFGIVYVFYAVRDENKFLLFCMMATQALECIRCGLDVLLEPAVSANRPLRMARNSMVAFGAAFMLLSWCFIRPMYKLFGWKIFRRGGAKRSIREMYKMFQRFRAFNLLDIQASFLLFLAMGLYLDVVHENIWVFLVLAICDVQTSRFFVKYIKREDLRGVTLAFLTKIISIVYWCVVLATYVKCYERFATSRKLTTAWWNMERAPDLNSVVKTYNGLHCLSPKTIHDDRTLETISLNFAQALVFRLLSMIASGLVCKNFGRGLRDVFYERKTDANANLNDDGNGSFASMRTSHLRASVAEKDADDGDPDIGEYSDDENERYAREHSSQRFVAPQTSSSSQRYEDDDQYNLYRE